MTTKRRDSNESPFSEWLRNHPEIESNQKKMSVTDADIWFHRYSERNEKKRKISADIRDVIDFVMLVELKVNNADMTFAQRDTLSVIDAVLRESCSTVSAKRKNLKIPDMRRYGSERIVRCYGVHLLQLSGMRPQDSKIILWDKKPICEEILIELLRFDRDPDNPRKFIDTRRHHKPSQLELYPQLKLVEVVKK